MDSGIQSPPGTTFFICGLRRAHTNALATAECTNLPPAHPLLLLLDELDNKTKRTVSRADRPQRAAGYQLISRRAAGAKGEDILPYFAGEQLSGLAETDLDFDGMVHFKMALWDGAYVHASVYKWDNVFTTWGRGRRNWTCAALWFHFEKIMSLGRTLEPTGEQFSLPITARSSWLDCSIAVISLAGRTQAKARSFYKNSSPVAAGLALFEDALFWAFIRVCCQCLCALRTHSLDLGRAGPLHQCTAAISPLQFHKQL